MNTQTEKPSVARAIAAALGANVRGESCIHGGERATYYLSFRGGKK